MRERAQALLFVLSWIVALALILAAVAATSPTFVPPTDAVRATLVIDGPGWTITYTADTANATAFGLLREASVTLEFELDWVEYGWPYNDVFVTSIHGVRNDGAANLWWQYCVNGAYAAKGAGSQLIAHSDVVNWVYAPPGGDELCR